MTRARQRGLLWIPRVLALVVCAYLAIFSLDAFDDGEGIMRSLPAFGMHLIPVAILLLVVVVAWRREWVGALVFGSLALVYAILARAHPSWVAAISGPLFLVGVSYLHGWLHHDELQSAA